MSEKNSQPIIFYDGDCGFCNRSVQFALNNEKASDLHFCALQSRFAANFFSERKLPVPDFSTFYFWDGEQMFQKSNAALRLATHFRFPAKLLVLLRIVPRFLRDFVYDGIAKRRHRISAGFCMLPTPDQRKRFISD